MGRLVGRSVSVKKVYWMGSKLKDMWVVAHFVYNKGLTLSNQFTQFVKIVRDAKEIAPYLWNWVKQDKVDVTASSQGKYSMLEVGE